MQSIKQSKFLIKFKNIKILLKAKNLQSFHSYWFIDIKSLRFCYVLISPRAFFLSIIFE